MNNNTGIAWTQSTWNPVVGCKEISSGCRDCYARTMARRLAKHNKLNVRADYSGLLNDYGSWSGAVRTLPHRLDEPRKEPPFKLIFVCSMGDLFHHDVPESFIKQVFDVMVECPRQTFQLLTKRSDRMAELAPTLPWPKNIWAGVTVESAEYTRRIDDLRRVPAHVRFLSMEPLLGPVPDLDLTNIHWMIVGCESGRKPRPMPTDWARDLRDQSTRAGVAFFLKQMQGPNGKMLSTPSLDGQVWVELPMVQVASVESNNKGRGL